MTGLSQEPNLISQEYHTFENYNNRMTNTIPSLQVVFTQKHQDNLNEMKIFLERGRK